MNIYIALATNSNWNLEGSGKTRRFRTHRSTIEESSAQKKQFHLKRVAVMAFVVCLAFSPWAFILRPASAIATAINIRNFGFSPQNMTVQTTDVVVWTNNDPVVYTLWFTYASNGSTYLLSPPINPGASWTHVFPDMLKLNYYDFDRLFVTGQLIVVPTLATNFGPTFSANSTITFSATIIGGTTPYRYFWNFGDGTTSAAISPTHTYQFLTNYNVTLSVTDSSAPSAFSASVTHMLVLSQSGGGGGGGKRLIL